MFCRFLGNCLPRHLAAFLWHLHLLEAVENVYTFLQFILVIRNISLVSLSLTYSVRIYSFFHLQLGLWIQRGILALQA